MPVVLEGEEEQRPVNHLHVDGDFFDTFGLEMAAGRALDGDPLLGDPAAGAQRGLRPPSVLVRLDPASLAQSLRGINQVWNRFAPGHPVEYAFVDE